MIILINTFIHELFCNCDCVYYLSLCKIVLSFVVGLKLCVCVDVTNEGIAEVSFLLLKLYRFVLSGC